MKKLLLSLFILLTACNNQINSDWFTSENNDTSAQITDTSSIVQVDTVYMEANYNKEELVKWVISRSGYRMPDRIAEEYVDSVLNTKYPLILLAIAYVESHYNPFAVSKKRAYGLYQIRPSVWADKLKEKGIINNKRDLFDYAIANRACEFIIDTLYVELGDIKRVLYKYVGGDKKYINDVLAILGEIYMRAKTPVVKPQNNGGA